MNRRRITTLAAAFMCCLLLVGVALAQTSASYDLTWNVIAGGGGPITGGGYAINSTIGQPVVGVAKDTGYELCSGFWCSEFVAVVEYRIYLPVVLRNYP
jgi:hypothetical protein